MTTPKASTRLSPEVRKEQILRHAAALFIERGFEAVDVPHIAERAGVSRPTIYKYFASTEAILEQLLDAALQAIWTDLAPVVERRSARDRARTYRDLFEVLQAHAGSIQLLHCGGGPLFHRYRRTLLHERLAHELSLRLPAEALPYKRLLDSVVLETLAFWAVTEASIDPEKLGETVAITLAGLPAPAVPPSVGGEG